ncbi:MAG: bifunctional diaminohydroxyphosphoribosylaminopyrimidine deaminase/5-amino-6-(5-phosphoribosylamino)uracil reductase RibD [Fimbriimonadaceae bacterium]|nr:bifunctional diaminohydroxyphosphoribosylaminopyrimidine deaminase/5-amino-6-(5-phosphoribosylamino)uracil reductase RibD [Chitinophagales bacterium]
MDAGLLYMQRCLDLASCGAGKVAPNPLVGAVLVHNEKVIGEGFHEKFGEAHAEVNAITRAEKSFPHLISESILYVNLEPCSHHGKTPPCTDLIIDKKIKRVIIGCLDPNPLVCGKGKQKLISAGIEVADGILETACRELNKYFISFHEKQRPYITLKWAQSDDGFIAQKNYLPVHLTNSYSDQLVHKMRAEHMAIYVGGRTVLSDNPKLTVRFWKGKNPIRVSLDTKNTFKTNLNIFNENAETYLFNYEKYEDHENVKYIKIDPSKNYISQILEFLYKKEINSLLVEGGAGSLNDFIKCNVWDEAKVFISGHQLKNGVAASAIPGKVVCEETIFNNRLITALNL